MVKSDWIIYSLEPFNKLSFLLNHYSTWLIDQQFLAESVRLINSRVREMVHISKQPKNRRNIFTLNILYDVKFNGVNCSWKRVRTTIAFLWFAIKSEAFSRFASNIYYDIIHVASQKVWEPQTKSCKNRFFSSYKISSLRIFQQDEHSLQIFSSDISLSDSI